MNAPQFGAAVKGTAAPVANSLPFTFAAASSTNPAIPDFKTVVATFFAAPTATTTVAPIETKSTADTKSVGTFLLRERGSSREKDAQSSELPAMFSPTIPVYSFPVLTPQAPKHMESLNLQQQTDTKGGSPAASVTLPLENQKQGFDKTLPRQFVTRPMALNVPFVPSQQTLKNVGPQKTAEEPVQNVPIAGAKEVTPPQAFAETCPTTTSLTLDDIDNGDVVKGTAEVTKTEAGSKTLVFPGSPLKAEAAQPQAKTTPNSNKTASMTQDRENKPPDANNITAGLNTTVIDTRPKTAAVFGEKLSSKLAGATAAAENKKSVQSKQSFDAQQNDGTDTNLADSTKATDQTAPQNITPQSLDDAIKAVIPQAVALDHIFEDQRSGHTISLRTTPSSKSADSKSNHAESDPIDANVVASPLSEKASPEQLDSPRAAQAVESTTKVAGKPKSDTTAKKGQKVGTDDQADSATATLGSTRVETQPTSSWQNAGTKVHDAVAQLNLGPHTKFASTKNPPQESGLVSPNATQVPDVDDITPPSRAGINTAKLVQGVTQSELRVGLQTRDFGNIDIRTSASRHEFSAQISVEHSEVAHTLNAELPNLYARLNEQLVPVNNIQIHNQSLSTSSGLDQRSQQSSQQSQSGGFTKQQMEPAVPVVHELFSSTDRLDIRV